MSRITYHSANVDKVGFCAEKEGKEAVFAEVKGTKQQTSKMAKEMRKDKKSFKKNWTEQSLQTSRMIQICQLFRVSPHHWEFLTSQHGGLIAWRGLTTDPVTKHSL